MLGLAAADFDSHVLSLPLALVLFCVPSIALCPLLEAELARATLLLSDAERARASLLSVNISEPGAEGLRTKYALTTAAPSLLLFRRGRPELYEGSRKAEAVAEFLRGVVAGRVPVVGQGSMFAALTCCLFCVWFTQAVLRHLLQF